jgi:hypothetical protein
MDNYNQPSIQQNQKRFYFTQEQFNALNNSINNIQVQGASVVNLAIIMQILGQSAIEELSSES